MMTPPPGSSMSSRWVVVCRPLPSDRMSPVAARSSPASAFTMVDLPTPDSPSRATVLPSEA